MDEIVDDIMEYIDGKTKLFKSGDYIYVLDEVIARIDEKIDAIEGVIK